MRQHKPPDCPVIPGEMANTKLGAQLIVRESVPELAEALIHELTREHVYPGKIAHDQPSCVNHRRQVGT